MRIDRPDDADLPRDGHPDRHAGGLDDGSRRIGGVQVEARGREEYQAALRAEVAAWDASTDRFRGLWAEYHRRWPPGDRPPADRSGDPPGSWRAEGGRFLGRPVNELADRACDRTAEHEEGRLTPALRDVETCDPDRHLVGLDHRLKGRDRIKEKVHDAIKTKNLSPDEAVSRVPDAVRYTFQYTESRYTEGVCADIERLEGQGFKLVELRNFWPDEQYKGLNSRWIDRETGQRFEVQFHTRASFEAKQLTHGAYERLRSGQADDFETMVLKAFQREVSSAVPIPPGATDIPDYPERGQQHAR